MDPSVLFFLGVLAGQVSFLVAFLLAKLTRHLVHRDPINTKSNRKEVISCPKCESTKYTHTETPGLLWCLACGNEYKNERRTIETIKEAPTPKRARFNFDDDGFSMGETGSKPRAKKSP